jgi:hypothetical protein
MALEIYRRGDCFWLCCNTEKRSNAKLKEKWQSFGEQTKDYKLEHLAPDPHFRERGKGANKPGRERDS